MLSTSTSVCRRLLLKSQSSSRQYWWHYRRCHHFASINNTLLQRVHDHGDDRSKFNNNTNNVQRRLFSVANNSINNKSVAMNFLSKEAATTSIDYPTSQRFSALPPAIGIHLAIGSVYVYSMWTPGMSTALGEMN